MDSFYKTAILDIYLYKYDDEYKSRNDSQKVITFGETILIFDTLIRKDSCLEFYFDVFYKGKDLTQTEYVGGSYVGMGYNSKTFQKMYYTNGYVNIVENRNLNSTKIIDEYILKYGNIMNPVFKDLYRCKYSK